MSSMNWRLPDFVYEQEADALREITEEYCDCETCMSDEFGICNECFTKAFDASFSSVSELKEVLRDGYET